MKLLCFKNRSVNFLFLLLFLPVAVFSAAPKSAVVYYGDSHPYEMLGAFDVIITDPGNLDTSSLGFKLYKKKIFAYVSVGEVNKNRSYYKKIKKRWIKRENGLWKSFVVDVSNREYQNFLMNEVLRKLYLRGFENFFFDTVDSYHLIAKSDKDRRKYEKALISFFKRVKKRYPKAKIILNRGFEIIEETAEVIDGVLFESLFYGLSPKDLRYKKVSSEDRKWLRFWIEKIRSLGLFVISLDYLPENEKALAEKTVKDIEKLGVIPYVAPKNLKVIGISSIKPVKREVLIIYNSFSDKLEFSEAFNCAVPLEYEGYIPKFLNIEKESFPDSLSDRYAGIIVWPEKRTKKGDFLKALLKRAVRNGVKVLFMKNFGFSFDKSDIKFFKMIPYEDEGEFTVISKDKTMGFEAEPRIKNRGIFMELLKGKSLFSVKKHFSKNIYSLAAVTEWGGYFQGEVLLPSIDGKDKLWSVNPFEFFKRTLRLKSFPVPDVTTKGNKRVLLVTVKCKGFNDKAEFDLKKRAYRILFKDFFAKYKIKQSVCVKSRRFKKRLSKFPYVKTYFRYPLAESFTSVTKNKPWLCKISPIGMEKEGKYEIFEPIADENLYTDWWRKDFWGYEKVLETFELTDKPRRLKPVHINYHYYSATKKASLRALKKVYDYAALKNLSGMFLEEYLKRAMNFYYAAFSVEDDGFNVFGARYLKTFRYKNGYIRVKNENSFIRK